MPNTVRTPGIVPGRLPPGTIEDNFSDLHPELSSYEAAVEAERCYFCYDAPCIDACPTGIDIPLFIRQIAAGSPNAAAKTIFDSNILGGMCARVCPTETLCEEACVRNDAEGKPVEIGRLQRFATDGLMATGIHPYERQNPTGRKIAVVGSGPAGLACAHRLATKGHDVVVFEAKEKPGGLNEYGIAAYKTVDGFAAKEVEWLTAIGGIAIEYGQSLGSDIAIEDLAAEYDAVFLAVGLAGVNALGIQGEELANVESAVDFIAELRQSEDLTELAVGRDIVVVGGGMTAIDAAVQSRLLGADSSTIVYRRERPKMGASVYEQDLAASKGVKIITNARPLKIVGDGAAREIIFERTRTGPDGLEAAGETFSVAADQVFVAVGQKLASEPSLIEIERGKIKVDGVGRTGHPKIWAGGDCATEGEDLTVTAVAQGRDAAEDIHMALAQPSTPPA
ncbi:MAG: NAD(P)-dependent oxidoreductase [Albidovulum sp.]|nr:NAD(P)-dependent oxidoreductase [Albidovulum sp.]